MDRYGRRRFLRGGAMAVAGAASATVLGCAATTPQTRTGRRRAPGPSTTGATEPVDPAAWASLASSLAGRLVLPASPAYATARLSYDPRFDAAAPVAVAYCASTTDVQRCVAFARAHAVRPVPRCGGHSYGGYSTGPGLVVDVTPMAGVAVAGAGAGAAGAGSGSPVARVGAGTLLVDLYDGLSQAGVLVPGGSCPTVGIAGLSLGGGVGVVGRRYGLTCDAMVSVEMVTADGRALTCDAERHADLYWACRGGGGGNFGVATAFTFRTVPIPDMALFTVEWPWAAAADVLGAWMAWQHAAPDELWSNCQLQSAGVGGLGVRSAGVLVGSATTLGTMVDQLAGMVGSAPSFRFVGPEQFLHAMLVEAGCERLDVAQCHLAGRTPAGVLDRAAAVASSAYVSAMPTSADISAFVQSVDDLAHTLPGLGGGLVFDAYGGAINAVAPGDTAFVHRNALCGIEATVAVGAGTPAEQAGRAWLAHAAAAMAPAVDGGAYQNYIDPTLVGWQDAYYGHNLRRLVAVKTAHDPDDVFRFAQSIPTARRSPRPVGT